MKDWPNSFWATIFIVLAGILAVVALYSPAKANLSTEVLTLASSIVTGAFGYIQGHKDGVASNPTTAGKGPAETESK